ncbi:MAG: ABC transporter ATP-binding protein [Ignavibacteriae bacterium]|nr:ABC transporter ATP-binding protein [Ignavibacteria bacterium]MBI3365309.1 ABC transporter ATP-binding protein [Ignavibacteriota bacterium]
MLEIHNVTKRFSNGVVAVADFSLKLEKGVLGLLGPNGAGKTTLMQMIATITVPTSGTILYREQDIVRSPDGIRRQLGYLPQDFGVYDNLTAAEFLSYIGALKGVHDRKKVMELLELVNLHTEANRLAGTFSGGMRQRLGIAQALINDPDIVIVDEPTAGLDPEERVRFRNILSDIGVGKLVILSTHIVSDVEAVATHIAVMNQGRLVASASPEQLLRSAQGNVWEAIVPSDRFDDMRMKYKTSRAVRRPDGVHVRIVHRERPVADASPVEPDLEEAFIFAVNSHGKS